MPVLERVDWILRCLATRKVRIHMGQAADSRKFKIKVFITPLHQGALDAPVQAALAATLRHLRVQVQQGLSVDRGHKHTDGHSKVNIWVSRATDEAREEDSDVGPRPPPKPGPRVDEPTGAAATEGNGTTEAARPQRCWCIAPRAKPNIP